MPAFSYDPFPGYAEVRNNTALGHRRWTVSADTVGTADHEPGATIVLTYNTFSGGTTPPAAANTIQVEMRLPGTTTRVGTVTWNPTTDGETRTVHLDDNPMNSSPGAARSGMVELYLRVIRTDIGTYDIDSRGNGADADDEWSRGFFRVPLRLLDHSVSNVAIAGAEPALFAYPDPIYVRATLEARTWSTDTHTLSILQGGTLRSSETENSVGPNLDFEQDSTFDLVDSEYTVAPVTLSIDLDSDTLFGNNGSFREYVWATAGQQAGWVDGASAGQLENIDRFNVDPTVTIQNEVLALPGSTVYNRGEGVSGSFEVHNARGEVVTPVGSDSVRLRRASNGTLEDTASVTRAGGVVSWSLTFASTGNEAPADSVGDAKTVEWRDTNSSISLAWPVSAQVGLLSSLLDVIPHLQLNDNALDPSLATVLRLTSDLGFYSVRITNQRGEGKNGVSVTDHLRDDQDLVAQIDRTDTTATVNGHDGWLPLKAWDSALPGGGWDHWTDAGAFEGNTFEKTRPGVNSADYTLLSINPNLIVIAAGGHDEPGEDGLHWNPGNDLLVGCSLFDVAQDRTVAADDDATLDPGGAPYPRAYMIVARFNTVTGTAQFFDQDGTWKSVEANQGSVYQWQLLSINRSNVLTGVGAVGDLLTYVHKFTPEQTADWGLSSLFFVPVVYRNSTPYSIWGATGVTGASNPHSGYSVDPVALGLHGVLGTR